MAKQIDINCDLGEGANNDELLMPYISSCNIACGGHFGDKESMINTIKLAKIHQVKIGAHPSFPDRENFGRQIMKIDNESLKASLYDQIIQFKEICSEEEVELNHIKLHGALYNLAARSTKTANLIIETLIKTGLNCKLFAPYQSELSKIDQNQFEICHEAFIDRSYRMDLSLVSRQDKLALISSPKLAWEQLYRIIKHQEIISVEGNKVKMIADTFCIHGDQERAVDIMSYIDARLGQNNIKFK